MGGHGGLNILPQKRWNVYGQKNRLKVHEDEAAHAEQQSLQQHKRDKAEREFKMETLRKRSCPERPSSCHINLFEEEERLQEHAENKREREMEERKRGRKSDRTSDARFDARFAFGHGLNDNKPWYALPSMMTSTTNPSHHQAPVTSATASTLRPIPSKKESKKESKKHRAKALLKELRRSNFKKTEIDKGLLRIERLRRERQERVRAEALMKRGHQST